MDHDVADMDADSELEPAVRRDLLVDLRKPLLRRHRALDGIHRARELGQEAVTGGVGHPPRVAADELGQDGKMARELAQRPDLIEPHEPSVARDVGREDGCELALRLPRG